MQRTTFGNEVATLGVLRMWNHGSSSVVISAKKTLAAGARMELHAMQSMAQMTRRRLLGEAKAWETFEMRGS